MYLPGLEPTLSDCAAPTGASDEWYTPRWILDWLPPIGLDPCWSADSAVIAARTFDVRRNENGLVMPWRVQDQGIVWCNPPYSDCSAWVQKCATEARETGATIVALIPAKPGEGYWHDHIWGRAAHVGFLRGRVAFDTALGKGKEAGTFGSALVVWGPQLDAAQTVATIRRRSCRSKQSCVWVQIAA